jgi:hypothetical protein
MPASTDVRWMPDANPESCITIQFDPTDTLSTLLHESVLLDWNLQVLERAPVFHQRKSNAHWLLASHTAVRVSVRRSVVHLFEHCR